MEQQPEQIQVTSNWEQQYLKGLVIGLSIAAAAGILFAAVWLIRRWKREKK